MEKHTKLHINPKALSDLEKIFEYSFNKWGIIQAEKYHDELHEGMKLISNQPGIGRPFFFKSLQYRIWNVKSHIIIYRQKSNKIFITRILHKKMDYKRHL